MENVQQANASVWIWGHPRTDAVLDVERYSFLAWIGRIALFTVSWLLGTALTLIFTFDPFVASFPFVIGIGVVYRGIRGRYRVRAFVGSCPRCGNALKLEPGSKINLPYRFDCFGCHFEPELQLVPRR